MKTIILYQAQIHYYCDKYCQAVIRRSDAWPTRQQALDQLAEEETEFLTDNYYVDAAEIIAWIKSDFDYALEDIQGDEPFGGVVVELICHLEE